MIIKKIACLPFLFLASLLLPAKINAQIKALRNIDYGSSIYENGYIDQPYVVVLKDKRWLCVFTTSNGKEGSSGQHIVSSISNNHGQTWSVPVIIEPPTGPAASWAVPYLTSYGRIYVFYDYNGDNITELNGKPIRNDMLGWYCFKYSDDNGQTWSDRYRLPVRKTPVDLNNDWKGNVQIMWGISKPVKLNNVMYFGFTKLGKYLLDQGEGWFFKCDNIDTQKDAARLNWTMLPEGDNGLRNPALGSVQEEHNIVGLNNGSLFCIYRTTLGYPAQSYSTDGGKTWTLPQLASYLPGGQKIKHPRACPKLFKCANGKYLLWFHNHSGKDFTDRNPAWLAGGIEKNGVIYWSQPEIALYSMDISHETGRMSYPDLIEQDGKYWITETQKVKARVHEISPALLQGMWNQATAKAIIKKGLIFSRSGISRGNTVKLPVLPSLKDGAFTLDIWVKLNNKDKDQVIFSNKDASNKGLQLVATKNNTVRLSLGDGNVEYSWETDSIALKKRDLHHIAFIVDGAPNIITVAVDGKLCDGASLRQYGWGRLPGQMENVNSSRPAIFESGIRSLRFYNRYLTTSEAISNYNAGPASLQHN